MLTKLLSRKWTCSPHADLSNVGFWNHRMPQTLEEGLDQNHRLQFNQGVKVKNTGVIYVLILFV